MQIILILIHVFVSLSFTLHAKEQKEYYLTSNVFKSFAEFCYDAKEGPFNPKSVGKGQCIFVKTDYIEDFFSKIHPFIKYPYVLITHDSDYPAIKSKGCQKYLNDKKLVAWFAIHVNYIHPKLHPIPIGIGYSDNKPCTRSQLQNSRRLMNLCKKKHLLYLRINPTEHKERSYVSQLFSDKPFCYNPGRKPWELYIQDVARSKFVLSPRGNGLDCFRTWESLYMGSIPIVKRSKMDSVFKGLPVLIIDEWTDLTEKFLKKKYIEMKKKKYSLGKLDPQYWKALINSYKKKAKFAKIKNHIKTHLGNTHHRGPVKAE